MSHNLNRLFNFNFVFTNYIEARPFLENTFRNLRRMLDSYAVTQGVDDKAKFVDESSQLFLQSIQKSDSHLDKPLGSFSLFFNDLMWSLFIQTLEESIRYSKQQYINLSEILDIIDQNKEIPFYLTAKVLFQNLYDQLDMYFPSDIRAKFLEKYSFDHIVDFIQNTEDHLFKFNESNIATYHVYYCDKPTIFSNTNKLVLDFSDSEHRLFLSGLSTFFKSLDFLFIINFDLDRLSSGQKLLLDIFGKVYLQIQNNPSKHFILLFDELDQGFHPEWQRNLFLYLSTCLKSFKSKFDVSFQLILTTHSPLMLSDFAYSNVKYLEIKNEVTRLLTELEIQTFGTNINLLLQNSFFIKNALIGGFAREKINDVIELCELTGELSEEQLNNIKQIINEIGEPIIREMIESKYSSKINKSDKLNYFRNKIKEIEDEFNGAS